MLLFGVPSVTTAGEFQEANDAYDRQDYATAIEKYTRAAEAGHAEAQYRLATIYQNEKEGEGVAHDNALAVRWYRKAAVGGHIEAQNRLGLMYANGRGIPQDDEEAVRWYRKAAAAGHALTQYYLALRYQNGKGVPQDHVQAHRWFSLAVAHATSEKTKKRAAKRRDAVAQTMSPQEIADAEQLAREWKPTTRTTPDR